MNRCIQTAFAGMFVVAGSAIGASPAEPTLPIVAPLDAPGDDEKNAKDFRARFSSIKKGMTPEQVTAAVGQAHSDPEAELWKWSISDTGLLDKENCYVRFAEGRVTETYCLGEHYMRPGE